MTDATANDSASAFESHLFRIGPTPYGGRGAFARQTILKGTDVLICTGPYVHVILRKFRREICAWCFAYAFEHGKNKWSVKLDEREQTPAGAWFCSNACRDRWIKHYGLGEEGAGAGADVEWWKVLNSGLEKMLVDRARSQAQSQGKANDGQKGKKESLVQLFETLEKITLEDVTPAFIEETWDAVAIDKDLRTQLRLAPESEIEMESARFVLDGLCRRAVEELQGVNKGHKNQDDPYEAPTVSAGTWTDFLELQENETPYVRWGPYMLKMYIRNYLLLKHLVSSLLRISNRPDSTRTKLSASTLRILETMKGYLSSPATFRAITSRDPGNVFGIWDAAPASQESEMLGWGAFSFGSYFNHGKQNRILVSMQKLTLRCRLRPESQKETRRKKHSFLCCARYPSRGGALYILRGW